MAERKKSTKTGSGKTTARSGAASRKSSAAKENTRSKAVQEEIQEPPRSHNGLWGVILLALGIFMIISYFSTEGKFVAFFADLIKGLVGWGFWLTVPAFLFSGILLLYRKEEPGGHRAVCALLLPAVFAGMAEVLTENLESLKQYSQITSPFSLQNSFTALYSTGKLMKSPGVLGGYLGRLLNGAFSVYGAFPFLLALFLVLLIVALRGTLRGLFSGMRESMAKRRQTYRDTREQEDEEEEPEIIDEPARRPEKRPVQDTRGGQNTRKPRRPSYAVDVPLGEEEEEELSLRGPSPYDSGKDSGPKRTPVRRKGEDKPSPKVETFQIPREPELISEQQEREYPVLGKPKTPVQPRPPKKTPVAATVIEEPPKPKVRKEELERETRAVEEAVANAEEKPAYEFPPVELLRSSDGGVVDAREEIQLNGERLQTALNSFGINAAIVGVIHGPTVTRYDIELEQGVTLSRVTNLAGDLALALGVVNVRIAPIPDKISTVGIEVPNKIVSTVYLRDIIESARFQSAKSKLSFALGKDIAGDCIVGNIAKLPHMLIAGTTGSGKSVCMNSLILSLLYKAKPDELRLIMIDPKMVELGVYNGIPHLYVPVVTDPKKAAGALQWSVVEMLKRYRLFSEVGVRDVDSYNKHAEVAGEQTLPRVVIVIDELADLMMVASKEVEDSIVRVAQMGRAAGMHLVIATQRPSADVITGLMKANIPSRIAFAVSSAMESRIILDQGGAEKLVGMGDMLFSPVGSGKPTRIQGAFVSDEEREEVIQFIKESAGEVSANDEILAAMEQSAAEKSAAEGSKGGKDDAASDSGYDEMLPQAVEAVLEAGSCSVSMLQRRVKLGYSRAARIVDQMEELGVVGPYEGAKPRSVVIDREGWKALQVRLGMADESEMALAAQMSQGDEIPDYDE